MIRLKFVDVIDYEKAFEYSSDERVTKYLTWNYYQNTESFSHFFRKMLELRTIENMFLSIFDDSVFLGTAHIIRRKVDCFQFGFGIMPRYWGKHYGETILRKIEEVVKEFNLKFPYYLIGECHVDNKPIQNILATNGYIRTSIWDNRIRYQKNIKESSMFINEMKENEMVESVIQVGSKDVDVDSDIDLVVILYEEASISSFISSLAQVYQMMEYSSLNHIFIRDETRIYDLYIVSSAFIHAFYSRSVVLWDHHGFISRLLGDEKVVDLSDHISAMCSLSKRVICKLKKNKLVQAVRLLGDIRDKHLICVYQAQKYISADSIINLTWNVEEEIYKECYLKTFCPPIYDHIVEALSILVSVLQELIDVANLALKGEIEDVRKKLYE